MGSAAAAADAAHRLCGARLNLRAGEKALASTAYAAAVRHLSAGIAPLPEADWSSDHDLLFALRLGRAKSEWLTGGFDAASRLIEELQAHARDDIEWARAAQIDIDLKVTQSDPATRLRCRARLSAPPRHGAADPPQPRAVSAGLCRVPAPARRAANRIAGRAAAHDRRAPDHGDARNRQRATCHLLRQPRALGPAAVRNDDDDAALRAHRCVGTGFRRVRLRARLPLPRLPGRLPFRRTGLRPAGARRHAALLCVCAVPPRAGGVVGAPAARGVGAGTPSPAGLHRHRRPPDRVRLRPPHRDGRDHAGRAAGRARPARRRARWPLRPGSRTASTP